jgi:inner membrane protein
MNIITHVMLGMALSEALMLQPLISVLGSFIPDIDYLIGIAHRTITHSLIFLVISCFLVYKIKDKKIAFAFLIGIASHFIIDSLTPMGIPLLYPLTNTYYSFNILNWDDLSSNLGLILASVLIILYKNKIHEFFYSLKKGRALLGVNLFIIAWFSVLFFFPVSACAKELSSISNVLSSIPSETQVLINGTICSSIRIYNSTKNNTYQIFTVCDKLSNITVWKGIWIKENNLSQSDNVKVCGLITRAYDTPEIYYVTSVEKPL